MNWEADVAYVCPTIPILVADVVDNYLMNTVEDISQHNRVVIYAGKCAGKGCHFSLLNGATRDAAPIELSGLVIKSDRRNGE